MDKVKTSSPMCVECARYRPEAATTLPSCDAFPGGVPAGVWGNVVDHTEPVEGDGGDVFLPLFPDEVGQHSDSPFLRDPDADHEDGVDLDDDGEHWLSEVPR